MAHVPLHIGRLLGPSGSLKQLPRTIWPTYWETVVLRSYEGATEIPAIECQFSKIASMQSL